jgi:hypothetical protein
MKLAVGARGAILSVAFFLFVAIATVLWAQSLSKPVAESIPVYDDALQESIARELQDFIDWLEENDAEGYIGELGWPSGEGDEKWSKLADVWYTKAEKNGLWTSIWAGGSWWGEYPLTVYGSVPYGKKVLSVVYPQATVFEHYAFNNPRHGVNIAGMEFSDPSAQAPGNSGEDYFYEKEASFAFLESRGIKTIRLPFSWERVQPELDGPLKESEVEAIGQALTMAAAHDIKVVLDLHNYGKYNDSNGVTHVIGVDKGMDVYLIDVWKKLGATFGSHPGLLGYGIMNEPNDLGPGDSYTPQLMWEKLTQQVVTELRNTGDDNLIFIPGYDWSSVARWRINHPSAWINDPAGNIRYEAHHYWDSSGSGVYGLSYNDELKYLHP